MYCYFVELRVATSRLPSKIFGGPWMVGYSDVLGSRVILRIPYRNMNTITHLWCNYLSIYGGWRHSGVRGSDNSVLTVGHYKLTSLEPYSRPTWSLNPTPHPHIFSILSSEGHRSLIGLVKKKPHNVSLSNLTRPSW